LDSSPSEHPKFVRCTILRDRALLSDDSLARALAFILDGFFFLAEITRACVVVPGRSNLNIPRLVLRAMLIFYRYMEIHSTSKFLDSYHAKGDLSINLKCKLTRGNKFITSYRDKSSSLAGAARFPAETRFAAGVFAN